jgi:segregation and condensation protein A
VTRRTALPEPRRSREAATESQPRVEGGGPRRFQVHLDVFDGPFDLLLGLVAKHRLDLTEVALATVTEEFLAHTRELGAALDLGETTEFLVVAATLLDLKVARLLPGDPADTEEDLALLEARDLLFARLLQYRAYRSVAETLALLWDTAGRRHAREAALEPRFAALLPEVVLGVGPERFAEIAAAALRPRPAPTVAVDHVHSPVVDVAEQAALLRERLALEGSGSFRALTADCTLPLEVVARFLALLELYRAGVVAFDQATPLGDLVVRWSGEVGAAVQTAPPRPERPAAPGEAGEAS